MAGFDDESRGLKTKRVFFPRQETSCRETSFFFPPRNELPRDELELVVKSAALARNLPFFLLPVSRETGENGCIFSVFLPQQMKLVVVSCVKFAKIL